jgi:hypothetical protein
VTVGSIKGLKGVTESRCISLVMTRGTNRNKLNLDVDPEDPAFRAVRGLLYRVTLERFRDVAVAAASLPDPAWLVARERQLWRPLLVLAHLADEDTGGKLNLQTTVRGMARAQGQDRAHGS